MNGQVYPTQKGSVQNIFKSFSENYLIVWGAFLSLQVKWDGK